MAPRKTILSLGIVVKKVAGIDFQGAGKLEDIIETNVLPSALHFADKIPVCLYHLTELLLRKTAFRADGTQACAER
jgi:hypothetical protein